MRGQTHGLAVFVADIAASQPSIERSPVGGAAHRGPPVGVLRRPRKQDSHGRAQVASDTCLLLDDDLVQFLIDGDQRLTFHLVVEVAQVGSAFRVGDDAVVRQTQRIGDPKSAADQDEGDQPVGGVGHLLRLSTASTWAMTCSVRALRVRSARLG